MKELIEHFGYLIVLFPLTGAAINGLIGRRVQTVYGEKFAGTLASAMVFLSFLLSCTALFAVTGHERAQVIDHVYTWISVGTFRADVAFLFDHLSVLMLLIITGIGFLIHVYSIGYMKGDPGSYRYFAYLNLFIFSMLVLVLAENALLMFVGWEGVGLCSYLLIGFWFEKKENASAANKAFIVNRVGDFGFIVGLFLLYWFLAEQAGPAASGASILSFPFLAQNVHLLQNLSLFGVSLVTAICLCLFLGATGKSAQIPLYVWLPDAMAGPTPVSALIHAATMVTAGIYMIARLNFLFMMSDVALAVIAVIGASTALFAATMGCVQNDIKKVLAYSTISQLGYMFLAMGVGAFSAGLLHVMTHAFFKACLFLGAGSVILGTHHEQDIRFMGGLKSKMPVTFTTFLIATLAIMGIPPFSGFFSKDEILWQAYSSEHGHPALWFIGLLTAGITSFYMSRLVFVTFFGTKRERPDMREDGHHEHHGDIHESPRVVTIPLIILACFAIIAGFAGVPESLGGSNRFGEFLASVLDHHAPHAEHNAMEYVLMFASLAAIAFGSGTAYIFYQVKTELPGFLNRKLNHVYTLVHNKYFIDEIYDFLFVTGTKIISKIMALFDKYAIDLLVNLSALGLRTHARIAGWFDATFVDGAVNFIADSTLSIGDSVRKIQTGTVQVYVLVLVLAVAAGIVVKLVF